VPFVPESIQLTEGGEDNPYDWSMTVPLTWTGTFRGKIGRLLVPASVSEPFTTDLASVPRSLTWLFPRYGRYTKAALLHDYLCQNVGRDTIAVYPTPSDAVDGTRPSEPQLLVLEDRSDADEIFRLVMTELRVPWARRWLMWSAVSWATLFTSIWPGRRSNPVLRWLGRLVVVAVAVAVVLLVWTGAVGSLAGQSSDWKWLRIVALVVIGSTAVAGSVLAAGYIALGRWDRWLVYLAALGMTVASLPLLAGGGVVAILLVFYLLFEDAFSGFSATRAWLARLVTKAPPVAARTPHAERVAAVRAS